MLAIFDRLDQAKMPAQGFLGGEPVGRPQVGYGPAV